MAKLSSMRHEHWSELLGAETHNAAGLAIQGAGAATYATANVVKYTIDGIFYSKAAVATQSLVTNSFEGYTAAQMVVPVNSTSYITVAVNAAGDVKNFHGSLGPLGTVVFGQVPNIPYGWAPLGFIKIVTGSAVFTPATTFLDATTGGMAITFKDVSLLPHAPSP